MLTQARLKQVLLYDPETGDFIRNGKVAGWIEKGYIRINIDAICYRAHRLTFLYMLNRWPYDQVDHIDLNRANNKWLNLREATNSQNKMNGSKQKNNTSGYRGIWWNKRLNKWQTSIKINQKRFHLGCFTQIDDAIQIYKKASLWWFGEYDNVNK